MEAVNQQSHWKPKWTHDEHLAMLYHVRTEEFDRTLPGGFHLGPEHDCWTVSQEYQFLSRKFASDCLKDLSKRGSYKLHKAISEMSKYSYTELKKMLLEWYSDKCRI